MEKDWYRYSAAEILDYWQSNRDEGLTTHDVRSRLSRYGYNELHTLRRKGKWQIFVSQFRDFMVLVLLGATLLSALLGEYVDAATILVIVAVNAVLGYIQEYRAEESVEALKRLTVPQASVIRNGMLQQVPARTLVPGDILAIETGQKIPADARLFETHYLEVEEAPLTGESTPVTKSSASLVGDPLALADRTNMVFSGTTVTRGRGRAVVCATGMGSEVGQIADMMDSIETEQTPLARRLAQLGRRLVWGCLFVCLLVVVTGVLRGESLWLMCLAGISLAVAAIPEGLPAIVTVALALGVQRMIRRNAIVRKLAAVETLGCVTVICSDKTGTLTQNVMTAKQLYADGQMIEITGNGYEIEGDFQRDGKPITAESDSCLAACLKIGVLCNNSLITRHKVTIHGSWRQKEQHFSIEGDPTEGALTIAGAKAGIWRLELEKNVERLLEAPFEPIRRRMSVVYAPFGEKKMAALYMKGAPDTILSLCSERLTAAGAVSLTAADRQRILAANNALTDQALRVLALAYRPIELRQVGEDNLEKFETGLVFAGLIGLIDPPRQDVKEAISLCRGAGIKTVMITGDHPNTAVAIARELRLFSGDISRVVTGEELDRMSELDLRKNVGEINVYARVSPGHKLRIVQALKARGHIVAMTGDGVNDAPAIKEADIGVAMGRSGTDVAKEASAMILTDDHFATIVAAIEEGRGIYDNIRKFIRYLLACNLGEVLTMFLASLLAVPLPLLPVQILWVNLVTDGLPALALGVDGSDSRIMFRPPRFPGESLFSRGLSRKIMARGLQIGISALAVFIFTYFSQNDLMLARTMAFTTLVFSQLFHVFDCRSEVSDILEIGLFSNRYLVAAVGCSVFMQLSVLYIPLLSTAFAVVPLGPAQWGIILLVSGWTFLLSVVRKIVGKRKTNRSILNRA